MTKRKKGRKGNPQIWNQVMREYNLTELQVFKAQELGLNPGKFRKYAGNKQQPWKSPLGGFIDRTYAKQFKGRTPKFKGRSKEEVLLDDIEALIKCGYRWYIKEQLPVNHKVSGFLGRVRKRCDIPEMLTKKTKGSCQLFLLPKHEFLVIAKGKKRELLDQPLFQSEPVNLEFVPLELFGFRFTIQKPFRVDITQGDAIEDESVIVNL